MKSIVLLVLALVVGCSPPIDEQLHLDGTLRVSTAFSDDEIEGIIAAVDEWKDATNGMVKLQVTVDNSSPNVFKEEFRGYNGYFFTKDRIVLAPWVTGEAVKPTMMHELGHGFGLGHVDVGLMYSAAVQSCIDIYTVQQFCEYHDCIKGVHPTCGPDVVLSRKPPIP